MNTCRDVTRIALLVVTLATAALHPANMIADGFCKELGTDNGIAKPGQDDFEWFMPVHISNEENWIKGKEGTRVFRALRPMTDGLVNVSRLENMKPNQNIFFEMTYKDVQENAPVLSLANDKKTYHLPPVPSSGDGKWKTYKASIKPENIAISNEGNYVFRISNKGQKEFPVSTIKLYDEKGLEDHAASLDDKLGFEDKTFWHKSSYPPGENNYETFFDTRNIHCGNFSLGIRFLDREVPGSWGGCFTPKDLDVEPNTNYRLSIYASADNVTSALLKCYFGGQKDKTMEVFGFERGSYDWRLYSFYLITPAEAKKLKLYFLNMGKGTIYFDSIKLEKLPPSETEANINYMDVNYCYQPRWREKDPALSDDIAKRFEDRGYVIYKRNNTRAFYLESIPQQEEICSKLEDFAAPGQYLSGYFMLYALRDISDFRISVKGAISNEKGRKIASAAMMIKNIRFWPQRSYEIGRGYYVIPELLENFKSLNISKNTNAGIWLQMKIPENTTPGSYQAHFELAYANGKKEELVWKFEILPFKLDNPTDKGIQWAMYSTLLERYSGRFDAPHPRHIYTDAQIRKNLWHMKDYGINSIWDMPWNDNGLKGKEKIYCEFENVAKTARFMKESGMTGPLILFLNPEYVLMAGRGKQISSAVFPELKEESFQSDFRQYLKTVDFIVRSAGITDWYFQGIDEPHGDGPKMERAVWEFKNAKGAGIKTYCTMYPYREAEKIFPYLDIDSNSMLALNQESCEKFKALAKKFNVKLWMLGAGCYSGQEGALMPDRYLAGFLFYKTGAEGHISWAWQYSKGDPRLDWEEGQKFTGKDANIIYPPEKITDDEVIVSTLQWEGIREGIDDYKYIYTLTNKIEKAKELGFSDDAEKAQKMLDDILNKIPWEENFDPGNCYLAKGNFSEKDAQECRRKIADEIIKLQNLCKTIKK